MRRREYNKAVMSSLKLIKCLNSQSDDSSLERLRIKQFDLILIYLKLELEIKFGIGAGRRD